MVNGIGPRDEHYKQQDSSAQPVGKRIPDPSPLLSSIAQSNAYQDEAQALSAQDQKTASGIILPPTGSYQAVKKDLDNAVHDVNNILVILQLLTMLSTESAQVQKGATIAQTKMGLESAEFQASSVDFQYKSDMLTAQATQMEGVSQMIGGAASIIIGCITLGLTAIPGVQAATSAASSDATAAEGAADAAATQTGGSAKNLTAGEDAGAEDADAAEIDEPGSIPLRQMKPISQQQEELVQDQVDDLSADNAQQRAKLDSKIQEVGKGAKGGADTKTPGAEGEIKEGGFWSRFQTAMSQDNRQNLIKTFTGLLEGISGITQGSIKLSEAAIQMEAASRKGESGYANVNQQLAQNLFQALGQTVSATPEALSKLMQAMEQLRRSTTDTRMFGG